MIPQIKKILYTTDLSQNSAYAFYYAVDLARERRAKIIILNVIEPVSPAVTPDLGTDERVKIQQHSIEEATKEIKNRLQDFCRRTEAKMGPPCLELVSKILVPLGHPPEEILNVADKEGCDLIILGTHGKGFLAHAFLGSVSSAVLHRTRKPVFIIPLPSEKTTIDWDKI
jgi:nucleotide-binding universal stress UspA family protein